MGKSLRKMGVVDRFYPKACDKIKKMFQTFAPHNHLLLPNKPRALIVPHAGYVYSGFTANMAYVHASKHTYKRIIVIGPSHRHAFKGVSASYYEAFATPCGSLKIDSAYLFALATKFNLVFAPKAHQIEHSTEVQMPFLKHYFTNTPIIELIYGEVSNQTLANLLTSLLQNRDNLVVVSTDLSHYYPLTKAKELDALCKVAIESIDANKLRGCEACGLTGLKSLLVATKHLKLQSKQLHYSTSANFSKDTKSVVGYVSAVVY